MPNNHAICQRHLASLIKLKCLLCLSLLFSQASVMQAQSIPFVDTNKVWSVVYCCDGGGGFFRTATWRIGDTASFGGNLYHEVRLANDSALSNWYLEGYVRETVDGKVYYSGNPPNDSLIYDFNLEAGDTIAYVELYQCWDWMVVDAVDTVMFFNQPRKRHLISTGNCGDPSMDHTWIEGVGSFMGPFNELIYHHLIVYDYSSALLCFKENDTVKYTNSNFNTCYYSSGGVGVEVAGANSVQLEVHPHPVNGISLVSIAGPTVPGNYELKLWDLQGRLLHREPMDPVQGFRLDQSMISPGIYLLELELDGKLVGRQQVMITPNEG